MVRELRAREEAASREKLRAFKAQRPRVLPHAHHADDHAPCMGNVLKICLTFAWLLYSVRMLLIGDLTTTERYERRWRSWLLSGCCVPCVQCSLV